MEFLLLLGLIPAVIARGKGRSFVLWWIYGSAILIIALPHSLLMKTNIAGVERQKLAEGMKKCPHCAELIKSDAKVCRYCGRDVWS
jgi:zinc-ribbon domain